MNRLRPFGGPLLAAGLFLAGSAGIGWGFGLAFLGPFQTAERAVLAFTVFGASSLLFVLAGKVGGGWWLRRGE